jgi:hypothetical protein
VAVRCLTLSFRVACYFEQWPIHAGAGPLHLSRLGSPWSRRGGQPRQGPQALGKRGSLSTSISFAPAALVESTVTILFTDNLKYPRVFRACQWRDEGASFRADRQAEYMSIQGLSLECSNQSLREGHQGPTRARDPASRGAYSLPGLKYDPKHGAPSGCHFRQLRTPSLHHPEHADTSFAPQGQRASGPGLTWPRRAAGGPGGLSAHERRPVAWSRTTLGSHGPPKMPAE